MGILGAVRLSFPMCEILTVILAALGYGFDGYRNVFTIWGLCHCEFGMPQAQGKL